MAFLRNHIIKCLESLESLSGGIYSDRFIRDKFFLDRQISYVDPNNPEGLSGRSPGVYSSYRKFSEKNLFTALTRDAFNKSSDTVKMRTIEGHTGSGKTDLLFRLSHKVKEYQKKNPNFKVVASEVVDCSLVLNRPGNPVNWLIWELIAVTLKTLIEQDSQGYQHLLVSVPPYISKAISNIKRYWQDGTAPTSDVLDHLDVASLADLINHLSRKGLRCVYFLDEASTLIQSLQQRHQRLFITSVFNSLINEMQRKSVNAVIYIALIDGDLEKYLINDGEETGAFRRLHERRLILGPLSLEEIKDLLKTLLHIYYKPIKPDYFDNSRIQQIVDELTEAISDSTASEVITQAVDHINITYKINNNVLEPWELYQAKTKESFLSWARSISSGLEGVELDVVRTDTYSSETRKAGKKFDHYVMGTANDRRLHFFGESTIERITPSKYNQKISSVRQAMNDGYGSKYFMCILSPDFSTDAMQLMSDDGVYYLRIDHSCDHVSEESTPEDVEIYDFPASTHGSNDLLIQAIMNVRRAFWYVSFKKDCSPRPFCA